MPQMLAAAPIQTKDLSNPDVQQSLGLGPDIQFFTIFVNPGSANVDVPVDLPKACKWIMLVSCQINHINDSLYMHFQPLNRSNAGGTGIFPVGNENWFPFFSGFALTKMGLYYKFSKPMPRRIYFDIGLESGGGVGYNLTFAVGSDIEDLGQLMNSVS